MGSAASTVATPAVIDAIVQPSEQNAVPEIAVFDVDAGMARQISLSSADSYDDVPSICSGSFLAATGALQDPSTSFSISPMPSASPRSYPSNLGCVDEQGPEVTLSQSGRKDLMPPYLNPTYEAESLGARQSSVGTLTTSDKGKRRSWIWTPDSLQRVCWDCVAFFCLLVELWVTSFELVFLAGGGEKLPDGLWIATRVVTVFFALDIVFNFCTGYVHNSVVIKHPRLISWNYLRCWFWIDLLATFPFDLVFSSVPWKGVKFVRAIRLLSFSQRAMHVERHFRFMSQAVRQAIPLIQAFWSLVLLAHIHACLWALLRYPATLGESPVRAWLALDRYCSCLSWAYQELTFGVNHAENLSYQDSVASHSDPTESPVSRVQLFTLLVASERLALLLAFCLRVVFWALVACEEDARLIALEREALAYLRRHQVSFQTQLQVLHSFREVGATRIARRNFNAFLAELPDEEELHRYIAKEIWGSRLVTLDLLKQARRWHRDFLQEASAIVQEEIFASNVLLFNEGDTALAAYFIISGQLAVVSSLTRIAIPNFTPGQWIGEKALINPSLLRSATVTSRGLTTLMVVPAGGFQDVLARLGLQERFSDFCESQLWRGLCGRCGALGKHFTHECPTMSGKAATLKSMLRSSKALPVVRQRRSSTSSTASTDSSSFSPGDFRGDAVGDLYDFLRTHDLARLEDTLRCMGVLCVDDLEQLQFEVLREKLAGDGKQPLTEDEEAALSPAGMKAFRDQLNVEVKILCRPKFARDCQHHCFLSHYKLEAGTEAALMRSELEALILDADQDVDCEVPVFLDSEDLKNLSEIQERVRRSQNVVLLLTSGVLTRPWVMVELVTAKVAGVPIVPVEVSKKGCEFEPPDEVFYESLKNGSMLDNKALKVLSDLGIEIHEIEEVIRTTFKRIAVPFSPHRSGCIRRAELVELMKQCDLRTREDVPSVTRSYSATGTTELVGGTTSFRRLATRGLASDSLR